MLDVEAFRIHIEATKCYADGVCEAEWNDRVHRPLLDAIMRKPSLRSKLICSNMYGYLPSVGHAVEKLNVSQYCSANLARVSRTNTHQRRETSGQNGRLRSLHAT